MPKRFRDADPSRKRGFLLGTPLVTSRTHAPKPQPAAMPRYGVTVAGSFYITAPYAGEPQQARAIHRSLASSRGLSCPLRVPRLKIFACQSRSPLPPLPPIMYASPFPHLFFSSLCRARVVRCPPLHTPPVPLASSAAGSCGSAAPEHFA